MASYREVAAEAPIRSVRVDDKPGPDEKDKEEFLPWWKKRKVKKKGAGKGAKGRGKGRGKAPRK